MITVIEAKTARQMRAFAKFPLRLYRGCPYYVPAIYSSEVHMRDPKKTPMLSECEVRCYLAYKDGKIAGRVAAILQRKHNEISGGKFMRFSRFDCIDDPETAAALIGAVEAFARERGMTAVHGPWGFNDQDREGLLTEGFDRRATYATNYNYPYYENLITSLGYASESEWVEYDFEIPKAPDKRIETIARFMQKKLSLTELAESAPMSKLIARYGREALAVTNLAYAALDAYVPVEGKIADYVLKQFATVINPRYFSLLANEQGEVVAMAVVLPSLCQALQKSGGRMTLPALVRLARAIAHPRELEMVLIAVRPDYQKLGVNAILMARIIGNVVEDKIEHIESNPELVSNKAVQSQWDSMGRTIVKRRKCYIKQLAEGSEEPANGALREAAADDATVR